MDATRSGDLRLLWRLLLRARSRWPHLACILLLGLLSSPLALLAPVPVKVVVDSVLGDHPPPAFLQPLLPEGATDATLLLAAVALLVAVALVGQLQELGGSLLRTYTGERLVLELRCDLFRHVQRLSFAWSDARGTADSVYRIQHDAPAIQSVTVDGLIPFVTRTVTIAGMICVAARIDWLLALLALGVCPCLLVALGSVRRTLRRRSRHVKKLESGALGVVTEVLSAIRVVKSFGQEDREQRRFAGSSMEGLRARMGLILAEGGLGLLVALVMAGGTSAVLYLGVRHVGSGLITLGDLLLVLGYVAQLYSPLRAMSSKAARLQSYLASAERAFALLDEVPDVTERPGALRLRRAAGAVELCDVTFAYDPDAPVLRSVSLTVPPGTRVGISGTTGAGKTTLIGLLSRFYDPTMGRILLDGRDLRDYRLDDLRHQFAIVLQEPVLFSTTIAENIAYGRPEAGQAEIAAAAEAAGAAGFIERLPQGYDTPVGERGMRLSGGERQRIALARAFLKDAPILILDEPTSSVDVATERTIMEALRELMRGRTTFMIAHRASTLTLCDMLVRIEGGHMAVATHRSAGSPQSTRTGSGP
jgi:ATP-binding cassette subfamily B protein